MQGPDAGEIAAKLWERVDQLLSIVIPDARREGREMRGHGPDGGVWSVVMSGRKEGVFCNWADQDRQNGDMLELVRWGLCGGDRRAAYAWALNWLGIDPGAYKRDPAAEARREADNRERARRRQEQADRDLAERKRKALGRYLDSKSDIAGTPAEAYLLHRGLALGAFQPRPRSGRHPLTSLRYAERCWHSHAAGELPAMIAPIVPPDGGQVVGVHQTYLGLVPGRPGVWGKAAVAPAKKCYGEKRGMVIPLLRGASNKSLGEAPDGDLVLIAEGIEDALTAALAWPEARVLAAVDIGNLALISLPEKFRQLILVVDRDGFNIAADRAREAVLDRWQAEGRGVELVVPPPGYKDVNAFWQANDGARVAAAAPAEVAA